MRGLVGIKFRHSVEMVEADKMIVKRVREGGACITYLHIHVTNLPNEDTLLEDNFHNYRCVYKGDYLQECG